MKAGLTGMVYIGLDLLSPTSYVHCEDAEGRILVQSCLSRDNVTSWLSKYPQCIVGIEASAEVHGFAARLADGGHRVMLINSKELVADPGSVEPPSIRAKALCRTLRRSEARSIPIRTLEERRRSAAQKLRAALHRQRSALLRTARILLDDFGREPFFGERNPDSICRRLDELASTGEAGEAADTLSAVLRYLGTQIDQLDRDPVRARR